MKKILYLACAVFPLFMTACDEFDPPKIRDTFTGTFPNVGGNVRQITAYDNDKYQLYQDANGVRRYLNIIEGEDQYGCSFRMYRYRVGNTWWYPSVTMVYKSAGGSIKEYSLHSKCPIPEQFTEIDTKIMYYAWYPKIIFQH